MFDSAKAVIFPPKGMPLFVEGLNPGHCVHYMHPPLLPQESAARRQREERAKAFLGCIPGSQLLFLV